MQSIAVASFCGVLVSVLHGSDPFTVDGIQTHKQDCDGE
jgi:hypothetical protein